MNETLAVFDMTGRRALVTGGAGLLGREFCRALVDVGASVFALDLGGERLEALAREIDVVPVVCDVTDPADVSACVDSLSREGGIDALVTSAAIDPKVDASGGVVTGTGSAREVTGAFASLPLRAWEQSLTVNLTGMFLVAQAVGEVMERQDGGHGRGSIVTVASTYGLTGPDQRLYVDERGRQRSYKPIDYPTTKAGVLGFTRALAAYYRETGIRVNALTPGGAYAGQDPAFVERYAARTIVGRMADPAEYRGPIAFLCSDASSYMTGANLVVDGGWTAL
jgi:2-deoxy-D-gluconate 3-dehydrogenase